MKPLEDYSDERLRVRCIHCSVFLEACEANEDHVPSKCLLDRPLPDNPPKVTVCAECNSSFAPDEEYLSVFLAAVLTGDAMPDAVRFPKAAAAVRRNPKLLALIARTRQEQLTLFGEPDILWVPNVQRVERVIVKNARGHVLHELGEDTIAPPKSVAFLPVTRLSPDQRTEFEHVDYGPGWPEVNSRLMQRLVGVEPLKEGWIEVQPDVYRYAVMHSGDKVTVRTLIRDYLATEVIWALD